MSNLCSNCVYPNNHPYGFLINNNGVCSGCAVHEEKYFLNWDQRFDELKKIAHKIKSQRSGEAFDCIVPVTGGGDSYFIVHVVSNLLELRPLLVHYNTHYNSHTGIVNLANLTTVFDADLVTSSVAPGILKDLTRFTLNHFGSIYWHVLAGNLTYPVQCAVKYGIPYIFWGVHPWSDQTGMFSHSQSVEMTQRCRTEHGLMGYDVMDLIKLGYPNLDHLKHFTYPNASELASNQIRGFYLGNFIPWDSKSQHEEMIANFGYKTRMQLRTFNSYEDVHCLHSVGLHDFIKLLKLGYSRITDHAVRELRLKRLNRTQALGLVKFYRDKRPNDIGVFQNWLDISEEYLFSKLKQITNSKLIFLNEDFSVEFKLDALKYEDIEPIKNVDNCKFIKTEEKDDKEPLLMGRGYIDKFNYGACEDKDSNLAFNQGKWKSKGLVI